MDRRYRLRSGTYAIIPGLGRRVKRSDLLTREQVGSAIALFEEVSVASAPSTAPAAPPVPVVVPVPPPSPPPAPSPPPPSPASPVVDPDATVKVTEPVTVDDPPAQDAKPEVPVEDVKPDPDATVKVMESEPSAPETPTVSRPALAAIAAQALARQGGKKHKGG